MNQKFVFAYRSTSPSLLPLKLILKEAKMYSPPNTATSQIDMDERLALKMIETMKKPYRRPSLFASWMGQPFPQEYREMVAADVR